MQGFGELKDMVQTLAESKKTKPKETKVAPGGSTPPYHNDTECKIVPYFPVNIYTEPMEWFLQQPIVQEFLYYETLRKVYQTHPVFKPESDTALGKFMDTVISVRLQTHFGKATLRVSKMDYSRFPMPMVLLQICKDWMMNLGKQRLPGSKDIAEFFKDRCNGQRRNKLLASDFLAGSESVEELAHRILAEREDFISKHEVND